MALQAKCSRCGKWITLVHPTKKMPNGARFRSHTDGPASMFRNNKCYGSPTGTEPTRELASKEAK